MALRDPGRPRRGILEIFVGGLIAIVALTALGAFVVAALTGRLEADPQLLAGLAVGVVVVVAIVVGAVRLVLLAAATRIRPVDNDTAPKVQNR